jgi:hypothetical protein
MVSSSLSTSAYINSAADPGQHSMNVCMHPLLKHPAAVYHQSRALLMASLGCVLTLGEHDHAGA